MLAWISDHAGSLTFLLGVIAILFVFLGMRSQRGRDFGFAAGVLGVIALIWLLTRFVVTDQQQISQSLDAMAKAALEKKPDEILKHVARDFRFHRFSREELAKAMARSIDMHHVDDIHMWDRKITVTGDTAEAEFNAKATASPEGVFVATVLAKFVREDGKWKMREVSVRRIGTTDPQPVPGIN